MKMNPDITGYVMFGAHVPLFSIIPNLNLSKQLSASEDFMTMHKLTNLTNLTKTS